MPTEHRARKRFGQNFLHDSAVIQAIVRAVAPQPDDTVIEIGPGLGALTAPLAERLHTLHVVEIDRDIVQYLQKQPFADKLVIHQGDVLQFDFQTIGGGRKKIVGNLPYNISTPLLFRLSGLGAEVADMHFMLQKEVVDRMCAAPGSKDYGRLGIVLQHFFDMEKLLDVPPAAFDPAPQVDSAVVRMIPDAGRIGQAEDFSAFSRLLAQAFSMRRKTLRNNLKNTADDADFLAVGIDPALRPENIPPEAYVQLSNRLAQKKR